MKDQNWYKTACFYQISVQSFLDTDRNGVGDFNGVREKLPYLKELGVNAIWLMPFYESPMRDGGYDISDFRAIREVYGSMADFEHLVAEAHSIGIRIVIDLVVNHTSSDHPWFVSAAKSRNSPFHDYYVWSEDDSKYSDARIIFLDTEKSNWTWNEPTGEYYWHRFYSSQPDLNYDNPKVIQELLDIADFWLDKGIDGFRVDAVPYLIEREGTNCENLPETHKVLKVLREHVDAKYQDKVLICEANQWPRDVREYMGEGDEFQVAFNFPLMPRMYMALKQETVSPIRWAFEQLPSIPENCQWATFLRNHDELTLEMVTPEERQYMWEEYSPDKRYRINLGIRRRLAPLMDNDRRKIEFMHELLFALPGVPFLYYGDEIGMGDDVMQFDRNGVRMPMQWSAEPNGGFSTADATILPAINDPVFGYQVRNVDAMRQEKGSLWHHIKQLIELRVAHDELATAPMHWLDAGDDRVSAFTRVAETLRVLVLANVSAETVEVSLSGPFSECNSLRDMITGEEFTSQRGRLRVQLAGHQCLWLV